MHTLDLTGSPVDLGGSWLHHPSGNPLRRFAVEAGVDCRPGDPLPTLAAFDVATGLWLSHEEVEEGLKGDLEGFHAAGAAEHQSLQWLWTQDEYDDAYFGDLPRNGYASVEEALASGLDIRLDWPVARVDLTGD